MARFINSLKITTLFLAIFTLAIPAPLFASDFTTDVSKLIADNSLLVSKQAACVDEGKQLSLSINTDMRIIPASVSKLYVFDMALQKLPIDFRYTTTFYLSGTTLYINGDGDPHFVIGHLRSLLNQVYAETHVKVTRFVFSPNFYFNWQSNPKDVQMALFNALKADKSLPIASRIAVVIGNGQYIGGGKKFEFQSMPLPALLKQINDYSTNISAEMLFRRLGGATAMEEYLKRTYGAGPETAHFSTGSGLSGNYTTCGLTLKVLKHLGETLKKHDLMLTDVLSMPVIDPGVLQKRYINPEDAKSIVAKSGFVNYHHALAGAISTKRGPVYFAIFTDFPTMQKSQATKNMVDQFVKVATDYYRRQLRPFDYIPDVTLFDGYKISLR